MRIAMLCSRVRVEEKLLLASFATRGIEVERLDDSELALWLDRSPPTVNLVFDRSISFGRSSYGLRALECLGVRCVNSAEVVATCGDKALTSMALARACVPTPSTVIAFTPKSALEAIIQPGGSKRDDEVVAAADEMNVAMVMTGRRQFRH